MPDSECLLFDGAMGTYYAQLYSTASSKCELANLTMPSAILHIHRQYIEAGCGAIRTNTFGANTVMLETGFEGVAPVIEAGWRLANEAAGGQVQVFADIGPIPGGYTEETQQEYARIADVFLGCGASRFVFETFGEVESVLTAAKYIKKRKPDAYILAQYAVTPDGFTRAGTSGLEIKQAMEGSADIDAWGFNCVSGPLYLHEYMMKLGAAKKPLSALPNAGYPLVEGNRTVYVNNPDYFASKLMEFRQRGVQILGGCCGTTPRHISSAARLLQNRATGRPTHGHSAIRPEAGPVVENRFWAKLERGGKVIAAELDPPQDTAVGRLLEGADRMKRAGADIITVADNPLARVRADSSMTASLIARRSGCEALPHIACRDRNLNAIKSLLLGLHIDGIRNILVVTGDPIALADRSEVKGVYNSNSSVLAGYVRSLNADVFSREPFTIGAALNINAANFDAELARAENKIARGVQFFLTQPAFAPEAIAALKRAKTALGAKLIAGIMPLTGYRNALFINNEVPGMSIPEATVERFMNLDKTQSEALGLQIAAETAREIEPWVDGYYVITPLNRFRMAESLIASIRREIDDKNR